MKLVLALVLSLASLTALAAPPERTEVFRLDRIDVERLGPLIDPIRVLKPSEVGSLIRVRSDFAGEIVRSAEQL